MNIIRELRRYYSFYYDSLAEGYVDTDQISLLTTSTSKTSKEVFSRVNYEVVELENGYEYGNRLYYKAGFNYFPALFVDLGLKLLHDAQVWNTVDERVIPLMLRSKEIVYFIAPFLFEDVHAELLNKDLYKLIMEGEE